MRVSEKLKVISDLGFLSMRAEIVAVVTEAERQVAESHTDDVDLELAAALAALGRMIA